MEAIVADVDVALKRWREVTTPLDHKSIDQDALTIASQSRFLLRAHSPTKPTGKTKSQPSGAPCRAWSHADFLQRVSTFTVASWFAKPAVISPLECARHGWTNSAPDMLQCMSCDRLLCCKIDHRLSAEGTESVAQRFAQELDEAHDDTCPWRQNPSPTSFTVLPVLVPSQASEVVVRRLGELLSKLKSLRLRDVFEAIVLRSESIDKIIEASQVGNKDAWTARLKTRFPEETNLALLSTAASLVVCGWTLIVTTPSTDAPALSCEYCNRHHILPQDTTGNGDPDVESPPRKRAKTSTTATYPIDPINGHRWFCPWVVHQNRGGEDQARLDALLPAAVPTSFLNLPGWQQFAAATGHIDNGTSRADDESSTTPQNALASVHSILSLPDCYI